MALVIKDRVKQSSTTAGTGTLTLSGTYTGYQSFSVIGNGNTTYYAIVDSNAGTWEIGVGTYTSAGSTLSRDTVLASSNGGAAVSFSSNSKEVFVTYPAGNAVTTDLTQTLSNKTINATTVTTTGAVGLGTSLVTGTSVRNAINVTGATNANSYSVEATVLSDVTSGARMFLSRPTTQATTFTLNSLVHYYANPQTFGAGSTVTNQFGFHAESSLTGATNNYGFYGNIAADTGRYNLYMAGTAINYLAGRLGVGVSNQADSALTVTLPITTGATTYGVRNYTSVPSNTTSSYLSFESTLYTQAAAFTLANYQHFVATQGTIGASSSVTTQAGFDALANMIGATNNYGFRGRIPTGTNRWNLFMDGTAENYVNGRFLIGTTSNNNGKVELGGDYPTSSSTAYGIVNYMNVPSAVTGSVFINSTNPTTAASAFTLTNLQHYRAAQNTFGAGSTVTNQYGFLAENTLTGATNNYGFYGNIPAGTNRWNLYMNGTASNYLGGALGIGTTNMGGTTGITVNNARTMTGNTTAISYYAAAQVLSDVTTGANYYATSVTTQAAAFTLSNLRHFYAAQSTFGAGSTVTNQFGYVAESNLTGATNNYGFYGGIAAGTGRWNLYMAGTADNYLAGALGIGSTSIAGRAFRLAKSITGATAAYAMESDGTIQSDVTSSAIYFSSSLRTAAAAFTVTDVKHFRAEQNALGAGSAITNQFGFAVESNLTSATNNYAFYGNIPSGTNRWNLFMNGTANNYLAGALGIGSTSTTGASLAISRNITGAITSYVAYFNGTAQSDVTNGVYGLSTFIGTQAASFTTGFIRHFSASQNTIGASSTATNQYGFIAESTLIGATSNYGFYGNIPAGTGRYNLYMAGTAWNYFAGNTGIGAAALTQVNLYVSKNITGATTSWNVASHGLVQSDVTAIAYGVDTFIGTAASAFTLLALTHYSARANTFGAGSTVTNQYGFSVDSSLTGATNNYGFYGNIAAGTNRYNLYMAGTAANYFAGDMQFDKTVTAGGTTGAQTIDKNAGSVNFAAAATSLVVTDSRVTTSSVIIATVATNDSTMKSVAVVAAAGSFTLYANAAATAETRVNFIIIN